VRPRVGLARAQGWKLHVSASVLTAHKVLRRVLPILVAERAQFKVAASLRMLASLNEGEAGISQIGKFVTVYPRSNVQAVRLAVALDRASRDLSGPPVPSDRALVADSLVHYRYGSFDGRRMQLRHGEIVPAMADPKGRLVPDRRSSSYVRPDWAADPFRAAGVADEDPPSTRVIEGRLLPVLALSESPRGNVYLALDLRNSRRCVVKTARRGSAICRDGRDARDQLRNEYLVLSRLMPDRRFPRPYELVELDGETCLVLEDLGGETLALHVEARRPLGHWVPTRRILAWATQMIDALRIVHGHGLVYRDVKPTNIVITASGRLKLIDFELAYDLSSSLPPMSLGTRGYMSPQQTSQARPAVTDDVYGVGAVLYFLTTGADPAQTPAAVPLADRPLAMLNPSVHPDLEAIIERCLDPDPTRRYPTMSSLAEALAAVRPEGPNLRVRPEKPRGRPGERPRAWYRKRAYQVGQTLIACVRRDGVVKVPGRNERHPDMMVSSDINMGVAGLVLALAELTADSNAGSLRRALRSACRLLSRAPRLDGPAKVPGLYVGQAGTATALLRAAQVLGDATLLDRAQEAGRAVARARHLSPDLFNGSAGRLRMHLLLWDETRESEQLGAAVESGEFLLRTARRGRRGEARWEIPAGFDALSGNSFLGYAHGAAGIADTLLDLYETCGDERFLDAATRAARWLTRLALPALPNRSGAEWPTVERGSPMGPMWCHGSTGIGKFFLHASRWSHITDALDIAERAGRSVAHGARSLGPVQCHGLAGNIEFLLDLYQATGKRSYVEDAGVLARLLDGFATRRGRMLLWPSDQATVFGPEYMTGYAGVAVCLLRLSDPTRRPGSLSRALFRMGRDGSAGSRAVASRAM